MKAISAIKRFFLRLAYGMPYGMMGANKEIMGSGNESGDDVSVSQEVSDERVAKHLLKGEVTTEVEELRYRTYKVAEEANNYTYLGGGIAVKNDSEKPKRENGKYRFTQANEIECQTVADTLKQVGSYGIDKYRLFIDYDSTPRFKLDKHATKVSVDIDDSEGRIVTTLYFNTEPNPYDATSMPLINELKRMYEAKNKNVESRSEVASSIINLSFSTFKANGEDDFVNYSFVNGAKYDGIDKDGYEYSVTYSWDEYMRLPLDLELKYYSKSMAEKYEKKERKNVDVGLVHEERKRYCAVCGKEMSARDAEITEASGGYAICKECMAKTLKIN